MVNGKQIRVYLVDGTPGGLLTAEIMNWTGHVVAAPRSDIADLLSRDEVRRTGVYILLGDDPASQSASGKAIYIGEGDDIAVRLRQHARGEDAGGKDFWDRVVVLTSKDANLTKAHARYLEARLIGAAAGARRAILLNGTAPQPIHLPEADISDMEYYLSQVQIVLPVLGITELRPTRPLIAPVIESTEGRVLAERTSPTFRFEVPRYGISARAQEVDGEFTVLEGSIARAAWVGTHRHPGYQQLHESLLSDGTLQQDNDELARFTKDVVFSSPSAAAAVVSGRAANGRTSWLDTITGVNFGEWQNRGIGE
ncbi:GIY-YIG nuclease family protein [Agromyces sp. SYSU K20354]|uniref:GIY-YIG nuclease family protein n=1 Tax=Agromyces cavernae TaxID=2898659 RepID=UPI001E2C4852|nr:GIY-YIG nuclease family protein [Agromyces cavernae]MCD2444346.1 GIY-YIG nuclease family protein [Agromyces cavernae]